MRTSFSLMNNSEKKIPISPIIDWGEVNDELGDVICVFKDCGPIYPS